MQETNPFLINTYLKPKYYCGRKENTSIIIQLLEIKEPVYLFGRVGVGKTALIKHVLYKLNKQDKYIPLYFDLCKITSFNELLHELVKQFPGDSSSKELLENLKTNENPEELFTKEYLDNIMRLLSKPLVIALDNINYFESSSAVYKFINAIIINPKSRLLLSGTNEKIKTQGVKNLELLSIPYKEYRDFILTHFSNSNRKISNKSIKKIFEFSRGETAYTQLICRKLWQTRNRKVTLELIDAVVQQIIIEKSHDYELLRSLLSSYQWKLLRSIATEREASLVTSKQFIEKHELNAPSSVKTALKALIDKKLIYRVNNTYLLTDPLFFLWVGNKQQNKVADTTNGEL